MTLVPHSLRSWDVDFPSYAPEDITPPELRTEDAARACGWAIDLEPEPRRTPLCRPGSCARDGYEVPLNPTGRTGYRGRNLPKWGENLAADALVTLKMRGARYVALIRRGDTGTWALPGGMSDAQDVSPEHTAVRELAEETGLRLDSWPIQLFTTTYVDDPRNTDYAWIVTNLCVIDLGEVDSLPALRAADDAMDADWIEADSMERIRSIPWYLGGAIYPAHLPLIAAGLMGASCTVVPVK